MQERNKRLNKSYGVAWNAACREIDALRLRGLKVRCPVCRKRGTLISQWVKKTPVKPLYIVHSNGNDSFKPCALDQDQAKEIRTDISFTTDDVRKTLSMGRPFVMFSGGKDSLCLLQYMAKLCKSQNKKLTAIHANTTAGFPEVEGYVRRVCKKLGVDLEVVRPPRNFFDLAKRWGIPGVRSRWCCSTLKIAPMRRYLQTIEGPKVIYDGIRAAESTIRATYTPVWLHPSFRSICVSPLFTWSDSKVLNYIKKNNLPQSPALKYKTSAECWCGAYRNREDFEQLLDIHPEIFEKLVEVEKAQKGKYTFIYEKGEHIPLASLKKRSKCSGCEGK